MTILSKDETNRIYKQINSVAYHNANETENMKQLSSDERKKAYFTIQRALRQAFLTYDKKTKLATLLKDTKMLDKYGKSKNTPKVLFNNAPSVKAKTKSKKKVSRI